MLVKCRDSLASSNNFDSCIKEQYLVHSVVVLKNPLNLFMILTFSFA